MPLLMHDPVHQEPAILQQAWPQQALHTLLRLVLQVPWVGLGGCQVWSWARKGLLQPPA